jgi:cytochrome c oxidase subunit 3
MLITILFAIIFTALQAFEYNQAPFTLTDSVFGSAFFVTTGLHGLHVIVGTIFILFGYTRFIKYHLTNKHHLGLENSIIY